jgi:hypothetical protein
MFENANKNESSNHKAPVDRDQWGRYRLPRPSAPEKGLIGWQRATTLAKMTSDMNGIMKWKMRHVAKGISLRPDLYALAASTDLNDKNSFDNLTEAAFEAAGGSSAASTGTALHSFTEQVDEGVEPNVPDLWKPDIAAYKKLVDTNGLSFPSWGIERIVVNEALAVAGTFDRICQLTKDIEVKIPGQKKRVLLKKDTWVVLDLKTGQDLSYGWRDIAIQLSIYANADAMWNPVKKEFEQLPDLDKKIALVIHLPSGSGEASLYGVDIAKGIKGAKIAADVRAWRKEKDIATLVGDPVAEDPFSSDVTDPVMVAVMTATSRVELNQIFAQAQSEGVWTDEHLQAGRFRALQLDSQ